MSDKIQNILFVCHADECRSPAAAAIFNATARVRQIEARAWSAGCEAWPDMPAIPDMVEVLGRRGYDLGSHRSRLLTARVVRNAELILCMSRRQVEFVREKWPRTAAQTYLLAHYSAALQADVEDPVGGRSSDYEECATQLQDLVNRLVGKLEAVRTTL